MIRPIVRDELFLKQKSEPAAGKDLSVITDLIDTFKANEKNCVGMAANMIGVKKRIIVIRIGIAVIPMVNPVIIKQEDPYETEESCLSLTGVRRTRRYGTIEVEYEDQEFRKRKQIFKGFTAQIIQHEVDHCNGIII